MKCEGRSVSCVGRKDEAGVWRKEGRRRGAERAGGGVGR